MPKKQKPVKKAQVEREIILPKTLEDGGPLPKLIVFDLDYTLWPFWVDTHVCPPLKATGLYNQVHDRYKNVYWGFYHEVPSILHVLREKGMKVAVASRTQTPELAREMLALLNLDPAHTGNEQGKRGIDYFDEFEIYPSSKVIHFQSLHKKTGIDYSDMLFFDDEARNRDVDRELGVQMILVLQGVDSALFDKGIQAWRKRRGNPSSKEEEDDIIYSDY